MMRLGLQTMFYKYNWGFNETLHAVRETTVKQMEIACCRRDSAAVQAVVTADEDFLLTVGTDALFWKGGRLQIARVEVIVPQLETEVRLIGLVEDDDRNMKSDPLLEQQITLVEKGRIQQVWIECKADEHTPPGNYQGIVRLYTHAMFEDEELVEECAFTVQVKETVLPKPENYAFYLDLWQHNSNIARKYDVPLWSDEHFAILDGYVESLAMLGQKAATVVVSEIPWSGQNGHKMRNPSDLFEYSMVGVRRSIDGSFHYDFTALDRYVALAEKHRMATEIEVFGLLNIWQDPDAGYGSIVEGYPDGIRIRYYDDERSSYRFIRERDALDAYVLALYLHMEEMGWTERVRILADEPHDFDQFQERVNVIRRSMPAVKLKVAIHHTDFITRRLEGISDYVPSIQCVALENDHLLELKDSISGKLLYYVACYPDQPNTFIGSPSIECRVLPWLAESLGMDGFLRWNYTAWPDRPLERIVYRPSMFRAGDTNFVYPGLSGRPVLTLRYKWLQRGIRDYELMQLLKASGLADRVDRALSRALRYGNPKELHPDRHRVNKELYSMDEEDYNLLIKELP